MKVILLIAIVLLGNNVAEKVISNSVLTIDHPNKIEYYKRHNISDEHSDGYLVKSNGHFHHTTTDIDGVRLGCYGYETSGKMYSTAYVADAKGYRVISPHDTITVYTKSGGERKASLSDEFNDEKLRSGNIIHFFPEACKGVGKDLIPTLPTSIATVTSSDFDTISVQTPKPPTTTIRSTASTDINKKIPSPPTKPTLKSSIITGRQTPSPPPTPTTSINVNKKIPPPPSRTTPKPPKYSVTTINNNSCCTDADSSSVLTVAIPMKNKGKAESSCKAFAKVTIQIDTLDAESLQSLTNVSDTNKMLKTIIKLLS